MSRLADLIRLRARVEADITTELQAAAARAHRRDTLGQRLEVEDPVRDRLTHAPARLVREWAAAAGVACPPKARVPNAVREAYVAAHMPTEPTEPAEVDR